MSIKLLTSQFIDFSILKNFDKKLLALFDSISNKTIQTPVYGFARSLLAIGTLINFVFNNETVLFDPEINFSNRFVKTIFDDINIFFLFGFEYLFITRIVSIIILIIVVWGIYPRFTGVLHWWVSFSWFQAGALVEGGDQITAVITFLLIPITILDKRKNHWYKTKETKNYILNYISVLFFFLIQLQVCFLYFHAAVEKMYKVSEWVDGTAVYYFFKDPVFGYPDLMNPLMSIFIESKFVFFISWGTILFELLLAGAFFMSVNKKKFLYPFGVFFHLLIWFIFGLSSFFFAMAGALTLYLIPIHKINTAYKIVPKK